MISLDEFAKSIINQFEYEKVCVLFNEQTPAVKTLLATIGAKCKISFEPKHASLLQTCAVIVACDYKHAFSAANKPLFYIATSLMDILSNQKKVVCIKEFLCLNSDDKRAAFSHIASFLFEAENMVYMHGLCRSRFPQNFANQIVDNVKAANDAFLKNNEERIVEVCIEASKLKVEDNVVFSAAALTKNQNNKILFCFIANLTFNMFLSQGAIACITRQFEVGDYFKTALSFGLSVEQARQRFLESINNKQAVFMFRERRQKFLQISNGFKMLIDECLKTYKSLFKDGGFKFCEQLNEKNLIDIYFKALPYSRQNFAKYIFNFGLAPSKSVKN